MAIFNTPRVNCSQKNYMENMISNLFAAEYPVLYRNGYGVFSGTAEQVIDGFRMTQQYAQRMIRVKIHCMELFVEPDKKKEEVVWLAESIGKYFYSQGFQCMVMVFSLEGCYVIEVVVNAVSFVGGSVFHDNNCQHYKTLQYLKQIIPCGWKVDVTDGVFFENGDLGKSYVKGVFE